MKLNKEDLLSLDEIKKLRGFKVLKEIFEDKRKKILNTLSNIQTYELIDKNGKKVIHTADNQMNEIRGRLETMELVVNLIENAKENIDSEE